MAKTTKNIYRAIMAHKLRFLMIALVIATGVMAAHVMISAFVHLDSTYTGAFKKHAMASFTLQTANPSGSGSDAWIDYSNLTRIMNEFSNTEAGSDVEDFEVRIVYDTAFRVRGNQQNGRIVAFNTTDKTGTFRSQPSVNGYRLLSGNGFSQTSEYRNVCMVEGHLAEYWKLEPNEFIEVGDNYISFQILGTIASPEYLMNMGSYADILPSPRRFGVIFMPLRTAQGVLNVEGKVNEISVKLNDILSKSQREQVASDLKKFLEDEKGLKMGEPIDFDDQVSYYLLKLDIEEAREMGIMLPILLLGMACGGLYILLGRMVVAERKDIGVSQALGYSRNAIIKQYLGIAIVVSIVGTLIGTIFGVALSGVFSPTYVKVISIQFPAVVTFEWELVIVGIFLGLITGFIGGYFPVKSAIQALPAESLRFDPSRHIIAGRISFAEKFLNKFHIRFRVTGFRLPLRNFFRSKRRTFSSVFAVIISVSIISMAWGMMESMDYGLRVQYTIVEDWDLKLDFSEVPTNTSVISQAIRNNIDGVSNSTYHLLSGATLTSAKSSVSKTTQLIGINESDGYLGHTFRFINTKPRGEFDPEGVVLTVPIAEKLRVKVGDEVQLEIPRLTSLVSTAPLRAHFEMINVSFRVSGLVDEFNGLVTYIGLNRLVEVSNFPGSPANTILIQLDDPTDTNLEYVRSEIYTRYNYNIRNIYTKAEQSSDLLGLLEALYWVMYVIALFAVLLAVAMVYNTVYINLQEQERELATLLTIGTPNRHIIRNITIENTVITIIGSFFGLIFGWFLLWFFMAVVLDMEFFRIIIFMSDNTRFFSFFLTLLGVLFAEYFPLRRALNLNLAEATKERVV
ncbi:MAG: FtsX-like permease family protein [Candidatus Heimdallarchaeota archaeon]|nr:FtsX-like permease family protein [Candidatus Heimdallarchaeota archaeon]